MLVLAGILILAGTAGGGYFVYVSVMVMLFLAGAGMCQMIRAQKIQIALDQNLLALGTMVIAYMLSIFWAVDSGMAVMGFVKYLPILVYFVFLCQRLECRESLIQILPMMGSLMTVLSFTMMQFSVFEAYVSVAGRLAGFFQYPNTYALFMLICLLIVVDGTGWKEHGWSSAVCVALLLFGILMSGSRTVFLLTVAVVSVSIMLKKAKERFVFSMLGLGLLVGIAAIAGSAGSIMRIFRISIHSSTFLGRLLYMRDAVPLILHHPFGIGYYGYHFMQQEIQTGVYSVVHVHNELLQFMLDVGIIPALLLYGCILRSIFSPRVCARDRSILIVLTAHSLFDHDLQFLIMPLLLLLFLDIHGLKEIKVTVPVKIVIISVWVLSLAMIPLGCSEYCYSMGRYEQALQWYPGNTLAETAMLGEAETAEEMERAASSILKRNAHVAAAYSARARAAFSRGDMEGFIRDKLVTLKLAPYQYEEYLDHLDVLFLAIDMYAEEKDLKSAWMCLKRAEAVPGMLEVTAEKTSRLGWMIQDKPKVELPEGYLRMIGEKRRMLEMDRLSE